MPEHENGILHHHRRPMSGRDINEVNRATTPLELLFDLTFVIAFGVAASQFAHAVAEGHITTALVGFGFSAFAICWAWINFSWFASAYDTDDRLFRVTTMVQMIGVLILALGIPDIFASMDKGEHIDNRIVVLGYVIMRVAMVFQWLRAARQDTARRRACLAYVKAISFAQIGWVVMIFLDFSLGVTLALSAALIAIEMLGPFLAESKDGGTPWHAHHIAERYSCMAIIALGEGIVGTVAALSAVIDAQGWTLDVALVGFAGTSLTFGLWWVFFMLPSAQVLHARRYKSFVWGYGLMITISSIVATGAGLHVAAYLIEGKAKIGPVAVLLSVVIPVVVFLASIYALYAYLAEGFDRFHLQLLLATFLVIAAAIAAAALGISIPACLVILTLAPVVTIVGHETVGRKHLAAILSKEQVSV
ncbi:MAG: low temperature requirement protein A [Pyrinomonadaceae bacterium]|nr:low temperature requirement protein A [Pyrinomonadaceae bacterium]